MQCINARRIFASFLCDRSHPVHSPISVQFIPVGDPLVWVPYASFPHQGTRPSLASFPGDPLVPGSFSHSLLVKNTCSDGPLMALPPPRRPGSEGGNFPPVAPSPQALRTAFANKTALKASCDAASARAQGKAGAKFGHHPRAITGSNERRYARWLPGLRGPKASTGLDARAPSIHFNVDATQCLEAAIFHYKEVNKEQENRVCLHGHVARNIMPSHPPLPPMLAPLREVCPSTTATWRMPASGTPCWSTSATPSELLTS